MYALSEKILRAAPVGRKMSSSLVCQPRANPEYSILRTLEITRRENHSRAPPGSTRELYLEGLEGHGDKSISNTSSSGSVVILDQEGGAAGEVRRPKEPEKVNDFGPPIPEEEEPKQEAEEEAMPVQEEEEEEER